jgi:hypothetical protein
MMGSKEAKPKEVVDLTDAEATVQTAEEKAAAKKKLMEKYKAKDLKGGAARYGRLLLVHACP